MRQIIKFAILSVVFLVFRQNSYGQVKIDTTTVCYYNCFTAKEQTTFVYQISNDSDEEYLTWVAHNPIKRKNEKEMIYDYFRSTKSYSFLNIFYDTFFENAQTNAVGFSFIKKISPRESFNYLIIGDEMNKQFYQERIAVSKLSDVNYWLREAFVIYKDDFERLLYPESSIILNGAGSTQ